MTVTKLPSYLSPHRTLLTEEQEKTLFTRLEASKIPGPNGTPIVGPKSKPIIEEVIRAYSPIVLKCARRYAGYGVEHDELLSEGTIAMVSASHRFDMSQGNRFATFCQSWVKGLMLAFITKNYFMVSACSNQRMKRLFFNLRRMVNTEIRLQDSTQLHPDFFPKVAEQLNVSVQDVQDMYALFRQPMESLSDPVSGSDGDDTVLKEMTIPSKTPNPEELTMDTVMKAFHKDILAETMTRVLKPRERIVLQAQMLEEDEKMRTLQHLADEYNLSKERVRQIRNRAYRKLKNALLLKFNPQQRQYLFTNQDLT